MSYIIKDNKQKCWLNIDRVVVGCDIITAIEPVYNYKAATEFSTEEIADQMIEQIKSEGQYDVEGYTKENKDALDMAERTAKEEKEQEEIEAVKEFIESKKKELEDELRKQGKSEEVIKKALESFGNYMPNSEESDKEDDDYDEDELSPKLFERPDMNTIDKTKAFVIGGWMDWPGGECFIKDIDLPKFESKIKAGIIDEDELLECFEFTDGLEDGGFKDAKLFSEADAKYILNLIESHETDSGNCILIGENDNFALSIEEYIDEALNGQNYIVKPCI